ncbi:hypothetical protein F4819DRAFT_486522 [Hypoxylon fuscum]|nr:hypothetical protein F4819DRAFT_486522 [Hypoxylon fuscum]
MHVQSRIGALAPTADEFTPGGIEANRNVLDATFVTHNLPDISPDSGVIGLCTVPYNRVGMEDQGWHVADFLAFKALLCGETHPKSQTWLSLCDLNVHTNPEQLAHGKDRRLVHGAISASSYTDSNGVRHVRDDQIKVEPSPKKLMVDFVKTLTTKARVAKDIGYPLVIIICGPTTLEQDVFFGKTDAKCAVTSGQIRHAIGEDIEAMLITPAPFSAGWQINPSLCLSPAGKVRADRTEFVAKQFGGVFAKEIVDFFTKWNCPFLDKDKVDNSSKDGGTPGPVMLSQKQKGNVEAFKVKLHGALAGRLSFGHCDHSFNFDPDLDDWERLVGPRQHKPLSHYRQKWENLEVGEVAPTTVENLEFLGNAFGGSSASQISHIKHLVEESFEAWPGYWSLSFGRSAMADFRKFLDNVSPEHTDCHEMFNVLEHRATSAAIGDLTVRYFTIPKPYEERCRDWDELKWNAEASDLDRRVANFAYGGILKNIPLVTIPPGVNLNHLSKIQRSIDVPATYLSVSLYLRYYQRKEELQAAVDRITNFFDEIKVRQIELLLKDPEVEKKCAAWLESIEMPILPLDRALGAAKATKMGAKAPRNQTVAQNGTTGVKREAEPELSTVTALPADPDPKPVEDIRSQNGAAPSTPLRSTQPVEFLSDETKKGLSRLDPEREIEKARQELQELVEKLVNAPNDDLVAIKEELVGVKSSIAFWEEELRKREEGKKGAKKSHPFGGSPFPILEITPDVTPDETPNVKSDTQAAAVSPQSEEGQKSSVTVTAAKKPAVQKSAGWVPPHLWHTIKKEQKQESDDSYVSPPSPSPQNGVGKSDARGKEKTTEAYVPPHLRTRRAIASPDQDTIF